MAGCLACLGFGSRRKRQLERPDEQHDQDPPIPIQLYTHSERQAPYINRGKDLPALPYNNRSSTIVNVGEYGQDHDQDSIPASHDIWITPPMTLPPLDGMSAEERLELARQKAGDEMIGRGPLPPKHRRPASPPTSPGVPLTNSTLRALQFSGNIPDEAEAEDADADGDDDGSMVVNNRNSMSTIDPAAKYASTLRAIPDDQSVHSYGDLGMNTRLDNNLSRRMSSGGLSNTSSYSAFTGVTGVTNTTANTANTFGMAGRYGRKASGGSILNNNLNINPTRALHPLAESMIPEASPSYDRMEFQKDPDPDSESDITTTTANTKAWLRSVENPHARPAPFMR